MTKVQSQKSFTAGPSDTVPRISIVIPCLNEAENLRTLLPYLQSCPQADRCEIILADGGSKDDSPTVADVRGVRLLRTQRPGRAHQMNQGAALARGAILYFLHADARPPRSFVGDITQAVAAGHPVGCYRFRFDSPSWLLKINSLFTHLPFLFCRGGDQSLFVTQTAFAELGGFHDDWIIMEDYDLVERAWGRYNFRVIPKSVCVSARKYEKNGWVKVQLANMKVFRMYRRGAAQRDMFDTYRKLLKR